MNYPIWELTTLGGGNLIALVSVLHVYIAHLAVGGGIFLWLTDWKGFRENNGALHAYVNRHTRFFLLITMVFGGVSGVGIWFVIALVNPAATSMLIHTFVFAWAIEWVFFVCEITALLIYHYQFDALARTPRLRIAFLYALFAWLSLVVINGILSFMLTPGEWLDTHAFWAGFLNPTFVSSTLFRTFMSLIIAGLFGFVTAVFTRDDSFRSTLMTYCGKWLLFPLPGLVLSAVWYFYTIPQDTRRTAFVLNPQSAIFWKLFILGTLVIFVAGIVSSLKLNRRMQRGIPFLLVVIGLCWMGGFEYSREIARKPYVIGKYMYSTSVLASDAEKLNQEGFLKNARWSAVKEVTADNLLAAGKELFNLQCLGCHTVGGIRNDVVNRSRPYTYLGMLSLLTGQGKVRAYMPPFMGTQAEKEALAAYITKSLLKKEIVREPAPLSIREVTEEIPAFNKETDAYVLLVWNDLGMHCVSDSDPWFVILPPANTLEAQVIQRGEQPALVSEGIEITYQVEEGFKNPAGHVDFWKYAESNFGKKLDDNVGLFGKGVSGVFAYNTGRNSFIAPGIPVVPYGDDGSYLPYPQVIVTAKNKTTGEVLATTRVVAPVSTEMGCRGCHEGGWRVHNVAGISGETSTNILAVHDRINGTVLRKNAEAGKPKLCQSCHADAALESSGKAEVLNFSAAMHGWHANYMPFNDSRACALCHPASAGGNTRCSRGFHNMAGLTCTNCHGTMQEHGLALLKGQADKRTAPSLMSNLTVSTVGGVDEVVPRLPWIQEPDCLSCHIDFEKPETNAHAYNKWHKEVTDLYRIRPDDSGIRCIACHGATHAEYPARNPYGKNRDNVQPLQYSGMPFPIGTNFSCWVCHTTPVSDAIHHGNMEHMFRNAARISDTPPGN